MVFLLESTYIYWVLLVLYGPMFFTCAQTKKSIAQLMAQLQQQNAANDSKCILHHFD